MLGMPRVRSSRKTKLPLFSQRKAAVGWRSWWCGNFLLLTEVYSEVQVGGNPNQAPRSTYILYVQKRCTYMFNQLCSVQRSTHERKKREWVGGVGQLIGWCYEVHEHCLEVHNVRRKIYEKVTSALVPGSCGGLVAWETSQLVGREGCCLLWQGNLHEVCNT